MFADKAGYDKAMVEIFRVFGVNIKGVSVTTNPAEACRTVYVENTGMRTGLKLVEIINEILQPRYEVWRMVHAAPHSFSFLCFLLFLLLVLFL